MESGPNESFQQRKETDEALQILVIKFKFKTQNSKLKLKEKLKSKGKLENVIRINNIY
jgi:hypothetical protein